MQCCTCSSLSYSEFKSLSSSQSWSCSFCFISAISGSTQSTNTVPCYTGSSSMYTSTVHSVNPLSQCNLIPSYSPTILLFLFHSPPLLGLLCLLLPLPLLTCSGFLIERRTSPCQKRGTSLSCIFPVNLTCIQGSNLNSSRFLHIMLCELIALIRGLALFSLMILTLAMHIFVRQTYSFLNSQPPLCLRLTPALIMYGSTFTGKLS